MKTRTTAERRRKRKFGEVKSLVRLLAQLIIFQLKGIFAAAKIEIGFAELSFPAFAGMTFDSFLILVLNLCMRPTYVIVLIYSGIVWRKIL